MQIVSLLLLLTRLKTLTSFAVMRAPLVGLIVRVLMDSDQVVQDGCALLIHHFNSLWTNTSFTSHGIQSITSI